LTSIAISKHTRTARITRATRTARAKIGEKKIQIRERLLQIRYFFRRMYAV
jgi:hypothetical protein